MLTSVSAACREICTGAAIFYLCVLGGGMAHAASEPFGYGNVYGPQSAPEEPLPPKQRANALRVDGRLSLPASTLNAITLQYERLALYDLGVIIGAGLPLSQQLSEGTVKNDTRYYSGTLGLRHYTFADHFGAMSGPYGSLMLDLGYASKNPDVGSGLTLGAAAELGWSWTLANTVVVAAGVVLASAHLVHFTDDNDVGHTVNSVSYGLGHLAIGAIF